MTFWQWDGNVERALALLPSPLFRPRDAFTVAERMGLQTYEGNRMWRALVDQGRVVRTNHLIGRAKARFFWERTSHAELPQEKAEGEAAVSRATICDGPHCERSSYLSDKDREGWASVDLAGAAEDDRFHFCSMQCLEAWARQSQQPKPAPDA